MNTPTYSCSGVSLTCAHCQHTADFEDFQHTPITGKLPPSTFQCPACRKAWEMITKGTGTLYPSGLYIPPRRYAKPISSFK